MPSNPLLWILAWNSLFFLYKFYPNVKALLYWYQFLLVFRVWLHPPPPAPNNPLFPEILIVQILDFLLMYLNLMAYLDEADLYKFRLVISMAQNTRHSPQGVTRARWFVPATFHLRIVPWNPQLIVNVWKFARVYKGSRQV